MNKKFLNWLFVVLWMLVIFYFSSLPELSSDLPSAWDFILRKIAHAAEYAILTFLLLRAFFAHQIPIKKALVLAALLAVLYAISDEYHQSFVFGREAAVRDVLIDSIGILGVALYKWGARNK